MSVLPHQAILRALKGAVPLMSSDDTEERLMIHPEQIQPASLDLRLGRRAYHVKAGALADNKRVVDLLNEEGHCLREINLSPGAPELLYRDHTYLIPLLEHCALKPGEIIECSPKSSGGRSDVYTRMVCNYSSEYDFTPPGYTGPLWVELTSKSFHIRVNAGLSLIQARFKTTETKRLSSKEVQDLHQQEGILLDFAGQPITPNQLGEQNGEIFLTVDLNREVVGFEARETPRGPGILDLTRTDVHLPADFWEPIFLPEDRQLVLVPGKFYLLVTRERVRVPKSVCGHVLPYKMSSGNFQVHYAGFFDNGFNGAAVMEVRARDVPFKIRDGQRICAMAFERTAEIPDKLYQGNYLDHRPSLSKYFKFSKEAWERKHWQTP